MFVDGFPKSIFSAVDEAVSTMPYQLVGNIRNAVSSNDIQYMLDGVLIQFPYRIYYIDVSDEDLQALDTTQAMILHCIYSRHCDGFVREKHLRALLNMDFQAWAVPYIVKVCDEYVVELIELIYNSLKYQTNAIIKQFCAENYSSFCKSYNRMISYWDAYYRCDCPDFHQYVGRKLFIECFGAKRTMNCIK